MVISFGFFSFFLMIFSIDKSDNILNSYTLHGYYDSNPKPNLWEQLFQKKKISLK